MRELFDPEHGLGLSYLRQPIGASDFVAGPQYTYDDMPPGQTDYAQRHFSIAHDDYRPGVMADKIRTANTEQLLIAQVETARGVENVEAIAAVEGLDVIWIGQADLTTSLGIPGQFTHPAFLVGDLEH